MGNCCCKSKPQEEPKVEESQYEDGLKGITIIDTEENSLLTSLNESSPISEGKVTLSVCFSESEDDPNEIKAELRREPNEEKPKPHELIKKHSVPMTGDRLLINELKSKFPDGVEDLKRRTRESNSFKKSQLQKVISTPPKETQKDSHEKIIDDLNVLEEKIKNTQKLIINNADLNMINILDQYEFDLRNLEENTHPNVVKKWNDVYLKLKASYYLTLSRGGRKKIEVYENGVDDAKKSEIIQYMEEIRDHLNRLELLMKEYMDVQKYVEEVIDSLDQIDSKSHEETILKDYLMEKSLCLIRECILKNI